MMCNEAANRQVLSGIRQGDCVAYALFIVVCLNSTMPGCLFSGHCRVLYGLFRLQQLIYAPPLCTWDKTLCSLIVNLPPSYTLALTCSLRCLLVDLVSLLHSGKSLIFQ